jgi:hypothetical protein
VTYEQLKAQVRARLASFRGGRWTERDVERVARLISRAALEGSRR